MVNLGQNFCDLEANVPLVLMYFFVFFTTTKSTVKSRQVAQWSKTFQERSKDNTNVRNARLQLNTVRYLKKCKENENSQCAYNSPLHKLCDWDLLLQGALGMKSMNTTTRFFQNANGDQNEKKYQSQVVWNCCLAQVVLNRQTYLANVRTDTWTKKGFTQMYKPRVKKKKVS